MCQKQTPFRSSRRSKSAALEFVVAVLVLGAAARAHVDPCPTVAPTGIVQWTTQWCDEFNGAAGSAIDNTKWTFDTGNLSVNNELEIYCAPATTTAPCDPSNPNTFIDGSGHLAIQDMQSQPGIWTSACLKTQGVQTFQYGRIEASIQIPSHPGLWPAFWMVGKNIDTVGWPTSGEVDIMENWPRLGATANATTLHGPGYSGANGLSHTYNFPGSGRIDSAFHLCGTIWSPNMVQFYVDDPINVVFVLTASDLPSGTTWPFNNPFFVIMNMAVGGDLGGTPDSGTASAGPMLVDYVRVYRPSTVPAPSLGNPASISVKAGMAGNTTVNLNSGAGTGRVYLSCTTNAPKASCAIVSNDLLNPHTVDFSNSATGTASVKVATTANTATPAGFASGSNRSCGASKHSGGSNGTPRGNYAVTVNAYTLSGNGTQPDARVNISLTVN